MATIDDIGVPGQPLSTPPLTAWQAAVRDAITAGQRVRRDTVGVSSVAYASASGVYTVTHTLGVIPTSVLLTPAEGQAGAAAYKVSYRVYDVSSTMFRIVHVDSTTGAVITNVGQKIAFFWQVSA